MGVECKWWIESQEERSFEQNETSSPTNERRGARRWARVLHHVCSRVTSFTFAGFWHYMYNFLNGPMQLCEFGMYENEFGLFWVASQQFMVAHLSSRARARKANRSNLSKMSTYPSRVSERVCSGSWRHKIFSDFSKRVVVMEALRCSLNLNE